MLLVLSGSLLATAQSLVINGYVVIEESGTEGTKLTISRNGEHTEERHLDKRGKFDLKLALGADYALSFERSGYITKNVTINTEVPEEVVETNPDFPPVRLIINLLPFIEGPDLTIFEQPIAILNYNYELDDFTFDKEYESSIREQVNRAEQDVRTALTRQSADERAREKLFAELAAKGQSSFGQKRWEEAIGFWTEALQVKPDKEVEQRIEMARKELELERENLRLAELRKQEAEQQKAEADRTARYTQLITAADGFFNARSYQEAIQNYRQALEVKPGEGYPRERIIKAEEAMVLQKQQQELAAEKERLAAKQKAELMVRYNRIIEKADAGVKAEQYTVARTLFQEADQLNTGESYPQERIKAIDNILNSTKYQQKLAEFKKQKEIAEQEMSGKNYAAAKFYFQKAMGILPIENEEIGKRIEEIDRLIAAEQTALIEKQYKEQIEKADKAWKEKAYAVARFYYQKALEVKPKDDYASKQLAEVEKHISDRSEKTVEL